MSQYVLVDIDDNTYTLPNGTTIPDDDKFSMDNKIIERSSRDGAVFPGISRMKSRELVLNLPKWDTSTSNFRTEINTLIMWCNKAVTLRDTTNSRETNILFDSASIKWEKGGHLRSSENALTFKQLTPYWQDVNYTFQYISGTPILTSGSVVIKNNGYAEMPLLITFNNPSGLIPSIELLITENNQGITIEDPAFGNNVLDVLIMDSELGTLELNGVKRNQYIDDDTGFITVPLTQGTLNYTITGNCDATIQYKARYYI